MVRRHDHITSHTRNNSIITGFINTLGTCKTIPIANSDVLYDCESTVIIIILSINNTLYFKGMNNNLIPPFMMRLDGLEVDECPKFLEHNPIVRQHSTLLPYLQLHLHLCIKGIISYLHTRRPDKSEEWQLDKNCLMPDDTPEWKPHGPIYSYNKINMVEYRGEVSTRINSKANIFGLNLYTVPEMQLNDESIYEYEVCTVITEANPTLNMYIFAIDINDRWNLGRFGLSIGSLYTGGRKGVSFEIFMPSG